MGNNKKKRKHPDLEELLQRPWCYYCERDFDDLKILIDHQRAKHFKCERCGRRLSTAGGLQVHMNQVHKETLSSIDNALPNRSNLDVEIFGNEGIPADIAEQHRNRVLTQYAQAEAERRAATGNPAPGAGGGDSGQKKVKTENLDDIKTRKAEFKAKKAAEAAAAAQAGNSPAGAIPTDTQSNVSQSLPVSAPPQGIYGPFPQPFAPHMAVPGQSFSPPQATPAFSAPMPGGYAPPQFQPPLGFQPPGFDFMYGQPFQNGMSPAAFRDPTRGGPVSASPSAPLGQQGQFQPPRMQGTPPGGMYTSPPAQNGFSGPAGLPQRPAFGAPAVTPATMQQMHQGQSPQQTGLHGAQANGGQAGHSNAGTPAAHTPVPEAKQASPAAAAPGKTESEPPAAAAGAAAATGSKKSKKDDKSTRMFYTDNEISPEEKMSVSARYAYKRDEQQEHVEQTVDAETIGALNNPLGDQTWGGPLGDGNFS